MAFGLAAGISSLTLAFFGSSAVDASSSQSTLALTAESTWVSPGSPFSLGLQVNSPLSPDRLSIKVSLYSLEHLGL